MVERPLQGLLMGVAAIPLTFCAICGLMFFLGSLTIDLEERGLRTANELLDIPGSAKEVRAYNFGMGQWASTHVRFELPENHIKGFLSANTCFDDVSLLTVGEDRLKDFDFPELPEWWDVKDWTIVAGGGCSRPEDIVDVITVYRADNRWLIRLMMSF